MDLGQRLKSARADAGMTQEELAKTLGVSRQTISNWENSRSTPDVGSIVKLGNLYHISLDKLLSGEEVIQQFADLAQRRRKLCQMMLEIGIILQLIGKLLSGLEFVFMGHSMTWAGFLLLTASIFMHLRVFHHDRKEVLRGFLGITGQWMLILGVLLIYGNNEIGNSASLVIQGLHLVNLLLIWSAGVWTFDLKSTRLWLIVVLWLGTPLLLSGIRLQDSGHLVESNPFSANYRVEQILYPQDSQLGRHAVVELGSDSMILAMDGVNGEYIGRFEYAQPTIEDTEKGIWLLSPEEDPLVLYKLTLEEEDTVVLSYSQNGQLQWKWKLTPDSLQASLAIDTFGHSSFRNLTWYPEGNPDLKDPEPYFSRTDVVSSADLTITIFGSDGLPLTLYEEYHHEGETDFQSYPLSPNEKGAYEIQLKPRYGGQKHQYAVYRIPFEKGEFRFVLTLQGF